MLNELGVAILPNLLVALLGWFVVSWLSDKRNQKEQRRLINITYLINAYRSLEKWVHHQLTDDLKQTIENAIADIQLFGTKKMIYTLNRFLDGYTDNNSGDVKELLNVLREELRKELAMESISVHETKFFRFKS